MLEKIVNKTKNAGRIAMIASTLLMAGCHKDPGPVSTEPKAPDPIVVSLPVTFYNDKDVNWIEYAPTNFNPNMKQFPSEQSIREDIKTLVDHNYKGIGTYGSDNILGQVPKIAKSEGVEKVVMGIWDPTSKEEFDNAVSMKEYVDGYCVGNEGLTNGRYTVSKLKRVMDSLRTITHKPVTTTEPSTSYTSEYMNLGDWVFPNAHPYWSGIKDPTNAAQWTKNQYDKFSANTNKVVVIKESGLPSSGESGMSEDNQNMYYNKLETLMNNNITTFAYFEAFDQSWKNTLPVEPHWGLFDKDRNPKKVAEPQIMYTSVPKIGSYDNLYGKTRNVKPENFMVSNYIRVNGTEWVKPYWNNPLVSIAQNGDWICDVTTGGIDEQATRFTSFLVTPDFDPNAHTPAGLPPNTTDSKVKAYVIINR